MELETMRAHLAKLHFAVVVLLVVGVLGPAGAEDAELPVDSGAGSVRPQPTKISTQLTVVMPNRKP